jgi:hypothetical protein
MARYSDEPHYSVNVIDMFGAPDRPRDLPPKPERKPRAKKEKPDRLTLEMFGGGEDEDPGGGQKGA